MLDKPAANERELVWRLYERYGLQAFRRINGSFALALFDEISQALVLAVDTWGAQPLYFMRSDRGWLFASEYKALIGVSGDRAKLDAVVAGQVVSSKYLPPRKTLDARIVTVGPGEYALLRRDTYELASYRSLSLNIDPEISERECAAELQEQLLAAADRLTDAHDVIGVGLSGGLDSAITLGAVRRTAPHKRIHAYTASFYEEDPTFDKAAEVARFFGAEHHRIVIQAEELPRLLPDLIWKMEDPVAREEMVVYQVIAERAARDVPIVLYGHMADVLFGGMPRHLLIKAASELPLFRDGIVQFYDYTQTGAQPASLLGKMLVLGYFRGRHPSPPRLLADEPAENSKRLHIETNEALNAALLSSAALPSEVGAIQKLHAWAGIEMASIFHDAEVSRCAFRIPDHLKIRGRCRKHILRVASAGFLPERFSRRPKDLIRLGRNQSMRATMQKLGNDLLGSRALHARGIFEPADVMQLCQRVARPQCADQDFYNLWSLILLELWCRTFADGCVRPCEIEPRKELSPAAAPLKVFA